MIRQLHLTNFKGHRDSVIELSPLTVLVGPNGSGKTSALQALHTLGCLYDQSFEEIFPGPNREADLVRHDPEVSGFRLVAEGTSGGRPRTFTLDASRSDEPDGPRWYIEMDLGAPPQAPTRVVYSGTSLLEKGHEAHWPELRHPALLHLDARRVAAPAPATSHARVAPDGSGVAAVIAHLKLADDDRLAAIEADLRRVVPQVRRVRALPTTLWASPASPQAAYELRLDVQGGPNLPASSVSDGTLLWLALLTVVHGTPRPQLLLLDDVHQGLHPKAQGEMMRVLRELTTGDDPLQVLASTHSPYIVDGVEPTAVQVFALDAEGSCSVRSLSEHPDAATYGRALSSGQLWTLDEERSWVAPRPP